MLQRRRLALMEQKADESDLAFITRVGAAARLCDYGKDKEFEETVGTVAEHALRKEIRTVALKLLSRSGTFTDLVDKVRELEAIRLNEEFFSQKHGVNTPSVVAPVRADFPMRGALHRYQGRSSSQRGYRGKPTGPRRSGVQGPYREASAVAPFNPRRNFPQASKCWRCNSVYHVPARCHAINKDCRNCGRFGHIQVACPSAPAATVKEWPDRESGPESARKTIAVVEKREESVEHQEVSENSEYFAGNQTN